MFSKTRKKESLGFLQPVKMTTNESGDHGIKKRELSRWPVWFSWLERPTVH